MWRWIWEHWIRLNSMELFFINKNWPISIEILKSLLLLYTISSQIEDVKIHKMIKEGGIWHFPGRFLEEGLSGNQLLSKLWISWLPWAFALKNIVTYQIPHLYGHSLLPLWYFQTLLSWCFLTSPHSCSEIVAFFAMSFEECFLAEIWSSVHSGHSKLVICSFLPPAPCLQLKAVILDCASCVQES